ncbi:MAG: nucleotidyltransferase domain-containing protein [Eubacterium sp.]|nr:nucleotidyltransferase domain-containing protein [Eubacterium sp.]
MIDIDVFVDDFVKRLRAVFDNRIWFVGLQGSYARGEADENSDVDMVVILNELSECDIERYNQLLAAIPERNLMCGFLSGKKELFNWNKSELFQFYYDTKPIIGSLDELLFLIDDISIDQAIKTGACSIYHSCVHNMLYEKSSEILKSLYKSAVFVIQAICFKQTGEYYSRKAELVEVVKDNDKSILKEFSNIKTGKEIDFQRMSEMLFNWSKHLIQ